MTNSIKGPDNTRRPPPSGGPNEGGSAVSFQKAINQLLSRGSDGQSRLPAMQGTGNDLPFGGANMGKRQDTMRTFAADRGSRLSEAWTDFVAGSRSFADLLGQVASSSNPGSTPTSGQTNNRTALAIELRSNLPLSDLLPTSLTTTLQPLSDPSPRSLGGDDAQSLAQVTDSLMNALLGRMGESSLLPDLLSKPGLTGLRAEAERLLSSLPQGEGIAAIRSLAREVIFSGAVLPEILLLTAGPEGSKTLGTAALVVHALLSEKGIDTLSPDLATALSPLRSGLESRFDDLLRALRLPGFTV